MPGDEHLARAWGHSFEEDHDGVLVYRPRSYAFPLARGRDGLELREDGSLVEWGPGPADAGQGRPGRWEVIGDRLVLDVPGSGRREMRIVHLAPDRLELAPDE